MNKKMDKIKREKSERERKKRRKLTKWKFIMSCWHGFHANWIHGECKLAEGQRYDVLIMRINPYNFSQWHSSAFDRRLGGCVCVSGKAFDLNSSKKLFRNGWSNIEHCEGGISPHNRRQRRWNFCYTSFSELFFFFLLASNGKKTNTFEYFIKKNII